MLYISWVGFPLLHNDLIFLLEALISSKDKEKNLMAGEKNHPLTLVSSRSCNFQRPFRDGIWYA